MSSTVKILLADDDDAHRELLRLALVAARAPVSVVEAATPERFLSLVSSERFDAVVLDYNFRPTRADELLMLASGCLDTCPVVVISSSEQQEVVIASFRAGVTDFMPKSQALVGDRLWARVREAIDKSHRAASDRRQARRRELELVRIAQTDPLTGLYNRRYLDRMLADGRHRHDRRRHVAVAMIDVDHFKGVNDRLGHAAGDSVLRAVGGVLRASCGPSETPVRMGGEEFLVLRPSATPAEHWQWADRLRGLIAERTIDCGAAGQCRVTVSVGIDHLPMAELDAEAITRADHALYLAKDRGRNRVCTWAMVAAEREAENLASALAGGGGATAQRERFLMRAAAWADAGQVELARGLGRRAGPLAEEIAGALGLGPASEASSRLVAELAELGRCVLPGEISAKPGGLLPGEWSIVHRAAEESAYLAAALGCEHKTVEAVRCVPVRHDTAMMLRAAAGADAGEPVPIESRVAAVAAAVAGMTSERPYRPARTLAEAIVELRRDGGRQYDAEVVEAAVAVLNRASARAA